MKDLTIGFIPLVDCAVLVAAHEKGFASARGLSLHLKKERAWATIRDKLNLGHLDAAHLLAGMPIAASLGIGQVQVPIIAPFLMSLNGNAITVSKELSHDIEVQAQGDLRDPAVSGAALKAVVAKRKAPLTFAVVYPFSCHNYALRYWLASAGIDPDRDMRLVVIPPPLIAESLMAGQIDGFCVGEPWSSLAVDMGIASIIVANAQLWRWGPEKVLGIRADMADAQPEMVKALILALYEAAAWCDEPNNHLELAQLLSRPGYVNVPAPIIMRALSGSLILEPGGEAVDIPNFMVFHRQAANFPWRSHALWLYSQMIRWGQIDHSLAGESAVRACFRSDMYRHAVADIKPAPILPGASEKVEGALAQPTLAGASGPPLVLGPDNFFDNRPFDPDDINGYLSSFPML